MKRLLSLAIISLGLMFAAPDASAQCPMCKTTVESSRAQGSRKGEGLNSGILYLMSIPYIIGAGVGILWYTRFRKKTA